MSLNNNSLNGKYVIWQNKKKISIAKEGGRIGKVIKRRHKSLKYLNPD